MASFNKFKSLGTIFFNSIKASLSSSVLSEIQIIRRVDFKLEKLKNSLNFLVACRSEKHIPRFLQFKLPKNVFDSDDKKQSLLIESLCRHIKAKEKDVEKFQRHYDSIVCKFNPCFISFLIPLITHFNGQQLSVHQERLKRKLENLQSFQMAKAYSSNKTVVNLS